MAALLFEAAADVLPDDPYLKVVTWQRFVILAGLIAVVLAGARVRDFRTRLDLPIAGLAAAALLAAVREGGGPQLRHLLSFIAVYYLVTALIRIERTAWRSLVLLVRDALWYCDVVLRRRHRPPTGQPVTLDQRIAELRTRRGADHLTVCAMITSVPLRRAAVDRVEHDLHARTADRPALISSR